MDNITIEDISEEILELALSIKKGKSDKYFTNYGLKNKQGIQQTIEAILSNLEYAELNKLRNKYNYSDLHKL